MLKRLELRNFRKHENLDIDFTAGLNAIRGPNEGGKSTIIESMLYALYGSKALRTPLAEAVTEGKAEKDLSVVMTLGEDTFKRSKAGAEVIRNGKVFITGQNEVSAYAAKVLGADSKTASLLMLAGQNDLRGALDEGPTKVSSLISQLADFGVIDRLLESAQANLLTGGDKPLRDKLEAADAELADAVASQPVDGSVLGLHTDIQVAEGDLGHHKALLETNLQQALDAAQEALEQAEGTVERRKERLRLLGVAERVLAADRGLLDAAEAKAGQPVDAASMERLRAGILAADAERPALEAWATFQKLPKYPADYWEGDEASFNLDLANAIEKREHERSFVEKLKGKIETLKGQRITSGKCPTCGHAARSDEHVAEHNAKIEAQITPLTDALLIAQDALRVAMREVNDLQELDGVARRYLKAVASVTNFVDLDEQFYPPKIAWRGAPPAPVDVTQAKRELSVLERQEREAREAAGSLKVLRANVDRAETALFEAKQAVEAVPEVDLQPLREASDAAYRAYSAGCSEVRAAETKLRELQEAKRELERRARESEARIERAKARVEECRNDLDELAQNNVLMAKLRRLRPAVTDKLWNQMLAAVSTFFSQMRGMPSVVTKDAQGFKVNGSTVCGLSGSTLDILALAIRVALVKTFIPYVPFLALDEPAHGCSPERTAALLGFVAGAGFTQTLIATHDPLSESVADNVILLGD